MEENQTRESEQKQLKGFYGKAKVSVKILDVAIVLGIIALFVVLSFAMNHRGFTIDFDSNGGTAVESQVRMYGEKIEAPENPTREGYEFEYWAQNINGSFKWDMENDTVHEPMKLYAIWEKK